MTEPKWAEIAKHCEEDIERCHRLLETIQPEATTNQLRGEVRALRRVLALGEAPARPDPKRMIQPATPDF